MGPRGKQKPSDASNEFSNALNREKPVAKGTKDATPPQPRGSKVAPGYDSEVNAAAKEPATNAEDNKRKKSSDATTKKIAAPKRGSSADDKGQTTAPPKRSSSAGKKLGADQGGTKGKAKDPEEDANGLYNVLVQTRRCEELCSGLGLTMSDIRKMKRKYDDNDMYHSGEITQTELFFMIREERRPLTVGILRLGDVLEDQKFLSFDQYLLCVVTFAVFTKPELYQFVFDLYDDDQSGALDEREFTKMSLELQSKQFQFSANVTMAVKMLGNKEGRAAFAPDDGLMDLGEFMKFAKNFPVAFYPIMNMQKNVRASTLGESRWSRITANKLKVQQLVSYMRQHRGGIPPLSVRESIANVFSGEISSIRKRAGELYALELAQRHRLSAEEVDAD
ncbi:hypothetical protein KRP22_009146 [Phytophthora ramorum]|uniref:uncharacterized protein n=1 Tax=Phytophthora ramorum TaxID=164328 RepID=UPI00309EE125|nr:hypothetical protein KRP23_2171 [Phytophthora ramorum]KAH7502512.1 hypothetical protein KRP22_7976 [Phytophthora ramorum]